MRLHRQPHDEHQAAACLRDASFKAVLIDMKLPAGDGTTVFRLVREATPQARTIVITGHRTEMDEVVLQFSVYYGVAKGEALHAAAEEAWSLARSG